MNPKQLLSLILTTLLGGALTVLAWLYLRPDHSEASHAHDHGDHSHPPDHHEAEAPRGPHGGRLLAEPGLSLEIVIFESGVPPQFRVYGYTGGHAIDPDQMKLSIELHRLGGPVDVHHFRKVNDYLLSDQVVYEPHSFDVKVAAEHAGKSYRWEYESHEGRAQFSPEMVKLSGIELATASPQPIRSTLVVYGRIGPNQDRLVQIAPRYPGVVVEAPAPLGAAVRQGDLLAVVESHESLQRYEIRSTLSGTILEKRIRAGESAEAGRAIYVVADLAAVWADLNVHAQDSLKIKAGQKVFLRFAEAMPEVEGEISYLSPVGSELNQSLLARVEIENREGQLRPGWHVTGRVVLEETTVPLAVPPSALQTFRDWDVVFIRVGDLFEARPVELGRRDERWVEIRSGLQPGQEYATTNSFVIKADILKSGAAHDH